MSSRLFPVLKLLIVTLLSDCCSPELNRINRSFSLILFSKMLTGCCLLLANLLISRLECSTAFERIDGFDISKDYEPPLLAIPASADMRLGQPNKRSSNKYKNLMLTPHRSSDENTDDKSSESEAITFHFPRVPVRKEIMKRGPGSILTWALYSKHPPDRKELGLETSRFLSPLVSPDNYRMPYGGGKSSAFVASMGKRSSDSSTFLQN